MSLGHPRQPSIPADVWVRVNLEYEGAALLIDAEIHSPIPGEAEGPVSIFR